MKIIIGMFIALLVLGGGGFWWWQTYGQSISNTSSEAPRTSEIKLTGVLQAARGDDYSYILISSGKSTGVTSQKIDLNQYAGKKVEVTGQYSGTTLYADIVTVIP